MRLLKGLGPSVLVFKVCCVRICSVEMLSKNEYVISIQIYMMNQKFFHRSMQNKTNEFHMKQNSRGKRNFDLASSKKRIFRTYKQALRKFSVNQIKFEVETFNVFYFLLRLLYAISSLLIAASKNVVGAKNPAINIWSYCWANVKAAQGRRKYNWQRQA